MYSVLLVDDEELALVSLRCALPWEDYGFTKILATTDPGQARVCLDSQRIDAAFVDIRMPGINGLELIEQARQAGCKTTFVIVTGYSDFSYAKKAIRLQTMDYCLKPVEPEEMTRLLKKLSDRIREKHLSTDPALVLKLLSDLSYSEDFLKSLWPDEMPSKTSLLLARCADWDRFFKAADKTSPYQFLFCSGKEVLIFWQDTDPDTKEACQDFAEAFSASCLVVTSVCETKAEALQYTLHRMLTEMDGQSRKTGLIPISPLSPEMTQTFSKVLAFIDEHYAENLTLAELSHRFGICYSYLSVMFKKSMNLSFSAYLTRARLTHACQMLTETRMKVTTISDKVGFNDYHYFCNVFKHTFGMSPLHYRNREETEKKES